jgi:hypothetical protein
MTESKEQKKSSSFFYFLRLKNKRERDAEEESTYILPFAGITLARFYGFDLSNRS